MLNSDKQYEELTMVSKEVVSLDLEDLKSFLYYNGVNYSKYDLMVIYKIKRMRDLGFIDEKKYKELIDLYSSYLELCEQDEHIFFLKNYGEIEDYPGYHEGMEEEIQGRISDIEGKLIVYGLFPDEMHVTSLIDDSIRLKFTKDKK